MDSLLVTNEFCHFQKVDFRPEVSTAFLYTLGVADIIATVVDEEVCINPHVLLSSLCTVNELVCIHRRGC